MTTTNEARMEISTICNNACVFCPHDELIRENKIMSYKLFEFLINKIKKEAPQVTQLTFSGMGEVFVDKGIMEKIELASKLGYTIEILTNGSLLTDDIINRLIELEIDTIRISFHSANKTIYMKTMQCPADQWDKVLSNINKISTQKTKTKLIITADVIYNVEEEIKLLRKLLDGKIDLLEVWKPHNWASWGSYREGEKVKQTCGRPFNGPFQIQVDGTINMCCFDYNGELEIGDFKTQTLKEIYNSDMYNKIVALHKDGKVVDSLICNNCDQLKNTGSIIYYNSKFTEKERVGRLSTTYKEL